MTRKRIKSSIEEQIEKKEERRKKKVLSNYKMKKDSWRKNLMNKKEKQETKDF